MFVLVLSGLSLTPNQVPALPFPTDPSHPEAPNAAFAQYFYPSGWRDADGRIEQEEPVNHNPLSPLDIYGATVLPAPPESSSHTTMAGSSSSLSTASYKQPGWQDDSVDLPSSSCGRVESTPEDLLSTQGQFIITQEASVVRERKTPRKKGKDNARKQADWSNDTQEAALARERKIQRKKELDKARKQAERDSSAEDYEKICDLLKIAMTPKNTLSHRSACLCIHPRRRS